MFNKKDNNESKKIIPKDREVNYQELILGILLLGLGLFMLSKKVILSSSWYIWHVGNFDISSGLVTVPLIIGIIWYVVKPKAIVPKIVITLGILFIVITIIMSIRIYFVPTSMYEYIIIMGFAAVGTGSLLKTMFVNKK